MRHTKVPYTKRRLFTKKVRETELKVRLLKKEEDWWEASRLQYQLRNCWWGYKWCLSH